MRRTQMAALAVLLLAAPTQQAAEISARGRELARHLDAMHVEQHSLVAEPVDWRTGEPDRKAPRCHTHCSAFVAAACARLGIYILRPPEHTQTLLANAQQAWLQRDGCEHGWEPVANREEAQRLANAGELVVASNRNGNPHKPGHIAIVRPGDKSAEALADEGPDIIQAGTHNYSCTTLKVGFGRHRDAWEHDGLRFFAHRWSPR
jgi:hypothetical protein